MRITPHLSLVAALLVACTAPPPKWSATISDRPWTTSPSTGSETEAPARTFDDGRGLILGRTNALLYRPEPVQFPRGLVGSTGVVEGDCPQTGTWCTVEFQVRFTAEGGDRLRIVAGAQSATSDTGYISDDTRTGGRIYRFSHADCTYCRLEVSIDPGPNGTIESGAEVFALRNQCWDRDQTNTEVGVKILDKHGRILVPR